MDFEALIVQAKQLPREQRERLAEELADSLQREDELENALERRHVRSLSHRDILSKAQHYRLQQGEALFSEEEHEQFQRWLIERRQEAIHTPLLRRRVVEAV